MNRPKKEYQILGRHPRSISIEWRVSFGGWWTSNHSYYYPQTPRQFHKRERFSEALGPYLCWLDGATYE